MLSRREPVYCSCRDWFSEHSASLRLRMGGCELSACSPSWLVHITLSARGATFVPTSAPPSGVVSGLQVFLVALWSPPSCPLRFCCSPRSIWLPRFGRLLRFGRGRSGEAS